jgi:hypothetical protein
MAEKTDFFKNYPKLIEENFPKIFDSEATWELLIFFQDYMWERLAIVARRNHPAWSDNEIHKCARFSLLNYLSGAPGGPSENLLIFCAMREWLLGDMDIAEQHAQDFVKKCYVLGAYKAAIEQMSAFSAMGEKFVASDGHKQKAFNVSERNATILADFQKLLSNEGGTLSKKTAYSRLQGKYDVTVRQLQRIIKASKNVI